MNSQNRQSTLESIYAIYDRYRNIVARGSCIKLIIPQIIE
jgi:hypothetical protein